MDEKSEKKVLTTCDTRELRRLSTKLAHEKEKALRDAGIPVSGEVMSVIRKEAWVEVKASCAPAELKVTPEQMEVIKKTCPSCASHFTLTGQARLEDTMEEIVINKVITESCPEQLPKSKKRK
jgi:hypothetical protein